MQLEGDLLQRYEKYLEEHIREEVGHDQWASEDLHNLNSLYLVLPREVSPSMKLLVSYIEKLIHRDVRLYLPYILFAEYFSVVAVPECAAALERHCTIPKSVVSVFTKHAELDVEHSYHDAELIDFTSTTDDEYAMHSFYVIERAFALYEAFLSEISPSEMDMECGEPREDSASAIR